MTKSPGRSTATPRCRLSKDGKTLGLQRDAALQSSGRSLRGRVWTARTSRRRATSARPTARLLAKLDLPEPESVTVKGAGGTPMQMWILKPPGFDPKKKWPLVYLVHGGPQGAWEDGWSFRWNPRSVGGAGLRRRPAQSARQHRLRPEIRRRDQRRLGRQVLRRPDGGPRLPGEAALHRQGPHGRGGRVVRRLHDELVRGQHRTGSRC